MIKYILTDGGQVIKYDDAADVLDLPCISPNQVIKGPVSDPKELCDLWIIVRQHDEKPYTAFSLYEIQEELHILAQDIPSNNPIVGIYGAAWRKAGYNNYPKLDTLGELKAEDELVGNTFSTITYFVLYNLRGEKL